MNLYSYVVARDYGFAPNPFNGICTLATCKPAIRERAAVGDWIVGIASLSDQRSPSLVYAMCVSEVLTYQSYWTDPRFLGKRPTRLGSVKQLFGDNIYHRDGMGQWLQMDSHHSQADGSPNLRNIANDTQSEGVLIGHEYAYWGSSAISIPDEFLDFQGESILVNRGYKRRFSPEFVLEFVRWFKGLGMQGCLAVPFRWNYPKAEWSRQRR